MKANPGFKIAATLLVACISVLMSSSASAIPLSSLQAVSGITINGVTFSNWDYIGDPNNVDVRFNTGVNSIGISIVPINGLWQASSASGGAAAYVDLQYHVSSLSSINSVLSAARFFNFPSVRADQIPGNLLYDPDFVSSCGYTSGGFSATECLYAPANQLFLNGKNITPTSNFDALLRADAYVSPGSFSSNPARAIVQTAEQVFLLNNLTISEILRTTNAAYTGYPFDPPNAFEDGVGFNPTVNLSDGTSLRYTDSGLLRIPEPSAIYLVVLALAGVYLSRRKQA